jgi:hypothetical protein
MALTFTFTPAGTLNSTAYGTVTSFVLDPADLRMGEIAIVNVYEPVITNAGGNIGCVLANAGAENAFLRISTDGTNFLRLILPPSSWVFIPEWIQYTGAAQLLPWTEIYARSASVAGVTLFVLNCTR